MSKKQRHRISASMTHLCSFDCLTRAPLHTPINVRVCCFQNLYWLGWGTAWCWNATLSCYEHMNLPCTKSELFSSILYKGIKRSILQSYLEMPELACRQSMCSFTELHPLTKHIFNVWLGLMAAFKKRIWNFVHVVSEGRGREARSTDLTAGFS